MLSLSEQNAGFKPMAGQSAQNRIADGKAIANQRRIAAKPKTQRETNRRPKGIETESRKENLES